MDMDQLPTGGMSMMGFDFSASQIIASLVFGVIGLYAFRHGKKTVNYRLIFISIVMMGYTMFTHGWFQDWGIGIGLCGFAYSANQNHNLTG